jgi:hypothetical protein
MIVAGETDLTGHAPDADFTNYSITGRIAADVASSCPYDACPFVSRDDRIGSGPTCEVNHLSLKNLQIGTANATRKYVNCYFAGARQRGGCLSEAELVGAANC